MTLSYELEHFCGAKTQQCKRRTLVEDEYRSLVKQLYPLWYRGNKIQTVLCCSLLCAPIQLITPFY